jgi:hypothetical protein
MSAPPGTPTTIRSALLQPGERRGGLVVLGLEAQAPLAKDTLYRVRYDCCAREDAIQRQQILKRERDATALCSLCARRARLGRAATPVPVAVREWPTRKPVFRDDLPLAPKKPAPSGREVNDWWDRAMRVVAERARRSA